MGPIDEFWAGKWQSNMKFRKDISAAAQRTKGADSRIIGQNTFAIIQMKSTDNFS